MLRPLVLLLLLPAVITAVEIPDTLPLWPGAAPGSEHLAIRDTVTERSKDPAHPDRIYTQIVTPSLTVHRPAHPNGVAVIIAPGGGYTRIVIDKEGPDTSAWLNRLGVTAFVLKYRLPNEGHERGEDAPLADAQRAVRLLRAHAAEWGLDPQRIGFCGYSAAGHLAASLAFYHDRPVYAPVDAADGKSARPDFEIIGYPMPPHTGTAPANLAALSPLDRLLWKYPFVAPAGVSVPPAFILQADDDPTVPAESAAQLYLALRRAHAPAELHIFRRGGHGFGIRDTRGPNTAWPDLCAAWLRDLGVVR